MQRYFAHWNNQETVLDKEDLHHIVHVMRSKVGDYFEVVSHGILYQCEIISLDPFKYTFSQKNEQSELSVDITLFFALAKGEKIEFVIQKATELGVKRIVLFKSRRCVVNFDNRDFEKKSLRFNKIAKEAAEQCHRLAIPEIVGVVDLKDVKQYFGDVNYVAYEKIAGSTEGSLEIPSNAKSISIMIGSEGGFDKDEIDYLMSLGMKQVSLGKRILRCETAAVYALSVLSYKIEK